jgi:hypothetical protein
VGNKQCFPRGQSRHHRSTATGQVALDVGLAGLEAGDTTMKSEQSALARVWPKRSASASELDDFASIAFGRSAGG